MISSGSSNLASVSSVPYKASSIFFIFVASTFVESISRCAVGLKPSTVTGVVESSQLNEIASGKTVYSKNLKLSFNRKPQDGKVANKKEKQILTLLGQGKTYQEIGTDIGLSKRTVEYHVGRLKDRFNAKTVAELIGRAKEQMLI